VAEVAASRGVDPVEAMIDLASETDGAQLFLQELNVPDPEITLAIMRHPRTVMTFSDAGAHVGQIMDCSIQTHLLAYWVRERQEFTLEEAVRMVTLAPARSWGFFDRGLIREGMAADINVFDPETIAPALPQVVHDLPGGARRLEQHAVGILATIVAGEVLIREGRHTGALPGRLLRGSRSRSGGNR
jgi:N-acyl-D-aspartate/D-glutamate deacylase